MKARFLYRAWKAALRDQRLEIAVARSLIAPGNLVIDAGANKGAYVYWLRKFAGIQGQVIAYEPQPELARYLRRITTALDWKNVQVQEVALSNRAGKSMLHVPGSGVSPGASLESAVLKQSDGSRFECLVDTLDHQLHGRTGLTFLKVDVEGHELALFQGGVETLRRECPSILFECEARHLNKHTMQDVFAFLREMEYEGFLLKGRSLLPVDRFDPAAHQAQNSDRFWDSPNYFNNFLFISRPLPEALKRSLAN